MKKEDLLDYEIFKRFKSVIEETQIFRKDPKKRKHFNLICTIVDSLETSIDFINKHSEINNEDEFLLFLIHTDKIKNAISILKETLSVSFLESKFKVFKSVCEGEPFNLEEEAILKGSDDSFFAYFRSLSFAHPFNTNRHKWLLNNIDEETHHSPSVFIEIKERSINVGVSIYTTNRNPEFDAKILEWNIPFSKFKEYVKGKYEWISVVADEIEQLNLKNEEKYKKFKFQRNLTSAGMLQEICTELDKRKVENNDIHTILSYLTCDTSLPENEKYVEEYREKIEEIIPLICNGIENLDYASYSVKITELIDINLLDDSQNMNYDIEKIFGDSVYQKGMMWKNHLNDFIEKYPFEKVRIDSEIMTFEEIKLLITIEFYLKRVENIT